MAEKLPWMRFVPADWLGCRKVSLLSDAGQASWIRILCEIFQANPDGGTLEMTLEDWATTLHRSARSTLTVLSELQHRGTADIEPQLEAGTPAHQSIRITSRRMVRDAVLRKEWREKKRGQREIVPQGTTQDCPPAVMSKPVTSKPGMVSPDGDTHARARKGDVDAVVEHYLAKRPKRRPGNVERNAIAARLKEGFTVPELCEAIDGCLASPFTNDAGKTFDALELIVRNSAKVNQYRSSLSERRGLPDANGVVVTIGGRPLQ